jgi:phospholipid transport system substrate-binding protein
MRQLLIALPLLLGVGVVNGAADSARQLVMDVSNRVIQALNKDPALVERDPAALSRLLDAVVLPHFDFEATARLVLGRYWRGMNPQQRQAFVQEFSTHVVRFYAASLVKYKDETIDYKPLRAPETADDVSVNTEVQPANGPPIPIVYRMHLKDGEWKVYDVSIDGISLVASNRSSFAAEIRRGNVDTLTARLARINRENGG